VKYTPTGNQVWVKRYDGGLNADDRAYAIAIDDTANVYIAGYSKNANNFDFITIKYDSAGTQEWAMQFNSQYDQTDVARAIYVADDGDVYVTGQSANVANEDFLTIRYSWSAVGISEQALAQDQLSAYPVPGSDLVTIDLGSETTSGGTLTVTDLAGRVVIAELISANMRQIQIDISQLAAGTYTVTRFSEEGTPVSRARIIRN
jgi:hypothetical protein